MSDYVRSVTSHGDLIIPEVSPEEKAKIAAENAALYEAWDKDDEDEIEALEMKLHNFYYHDEIKELGLDRDDDDEDESTDEEGGCEMAGTSQRARLAPMDDRRAAAEQLELKLAEFGDYEAQLDEEFVGPGQVQRQQSSSYVTTSAAFHGADDPCADQRALADDLERRLYMRNVDSGDAQLENEFIDADRKLKMVLRPHDDVVDDQTITSMIYDDRFTPEATGYHASTSQQQQQEGKLQIKELSPDEQELNEILADSSRACEDW